GHLQEDRRAQWRQDLGGVAGWLWLQLQIHIALPWSRSYRRSASMKLPELLVVDDNPADVALVCEALAGSLRHSKINSVGDGVEAMAFLDRREKYANVPQPDLVILDLNLPK